jgi:dehydrogenase/reductase SDR family protein 1
MKTRASLAGKVAVVTGASRGVGAGIAMMLGERGATVYVTVRTTGRKPGATPGTINEVADSITNAGGIAIAVPCDHADDIDAKLMILMLKG